MDNLCHTLVGAAIGQAGLKRRTGLGMATLMIGANFPDIDVVAVPLGHSLEFRRGWTHGVPALALGVLPVAVGMAIGHGFLLVWGAFMLHAATGDLIVLWTIRSVPGRARVLDHPERVGCRVLAAAPQED